MRMAGRTFTQTVKVISLGQKNRSELCEAFAKQLGEFDFFFSSRRRHTRCLSDWSSDVCSSDLVWLGFLVQQADQRVAPQTSADSLTFQRSKPAEDQRPRNRHGELGAMREGLHDLAHRVGVLVSGGNRARRSEERRVGKECGSRA